MLSSLAEVQSFTPRLRYLVASERPRRSAVFQRTLTAMPTSWDFHPLCFEHHIEMHHIEMKVSQILANAPKPTQVPSYACAQPNCFIHYNIEQGYFSTQKREQIERDVTPRVSCPRDGRSMYLAEVKPDKRNFRLWRCPHCNLSQTNEEVSQV
jgi:hypothetical protein